MIKKCLFISYGGGHANTLMPVIKELMKQENYKCSVIGINLAADTFRENGIPCKSLSSYMDDEILTLGLPLARQFHDFNSKVTYADSIAYYGFSMFDLISEKGIEFANEVLQVYDRRLFLPIKSMEKILGIEKPDIVITTTMHRFEAATILAANQLGIASIRIEDLLGNINKPFPDKIIVNSLSEKETLIKQGINENKIILSSSLKNDKLSEYADEVYDIYCKMKPTKFAVMSKYTKENILNRGFNDEDVEITGQPAFDHLINNEYDPKKLKSELRLDANKKVVTYMSQPLPIRETTIKSIIMAMKEVENAQLIIKLHPNEDGKIHELLLEETDYKATVVKNYKACDIMDISDLVITISSTTGIEAALMKKQVLSINLTGEADFIPFKKMGIGEIAYNADEVKKEIKMFLEKDAVNSNDSIVADFKADGRSAQRVVELIKQLLN